MASKAEQPDNKTSKMQAIIGLLLASVVAVGVGFGYGMIFAPKSANAPTPAPEKPPIEKAASKPASKGHGKEAKHGRVLHQVKPVIANLKLPEKMWVRIDSAVLINEDGVENSDALVSALAEDILGYVRTLSLSDIEGPIGFLNLRQDLQRRARIRAGGKVEDFFILAMVVQ